MGNHKHLFDIMYRCEEEVDRKNISSNLILKMWEVEQIYGK